MIVAMCDFNLKTLRLIVAVCFDDMAALRPAVRRMVEHLVERTRPAEAAS